MTSQEAQPGEHDHQLPILGQDDTDPRGLPELSPSTLIGFFDGDQPSVDQVLERLSAAFGAGVEFHGEPPERPEQAFWAVVLELEGHGLPLVLWSEPVEQEAMQVPPFAKSARVMIGVQSMLDPDDPLESWRLMVRLLGVTADDLSAMLDIETEQWFSGEEVAVRLLGGEAAPEETMLFRIHAASTVEEPREGDKVWLRTLGLHRCGRPELEMLEVEGPALPLAHDLLEAVAALCIQRGVPEPGFPFEAGVNVALSLQPLSEQLELLSDNAVGTLAQRIQMEGTEGSGNPMLAGRAIVCGAEPRGSFRAIHTWPIEAVGHLERGEGGLERTENWTRSMSAEARRLWPRLLEGVRGGLAAQACIALAAGEAGREQVWIQVDSATESEVTGSLLSRPAQLELAPGDVLTASLDDLVDWRLMEQQNA